MSITSGTTTSAVPAPKSDYERGYQAGFQAGFQTGLTQSQPYVSPHNPYVPPWNPRDPIYWTCGPSTVVASYEEPNPFLNFQTYHDDKSHVKEEPQFLSEVFKDRMTNG